MRDLLGPSFLSGFRLGDWLRLLQENKFSVDPPFWPRAAVATAGCGITSCLARGEAMLTQADIDKDLWERPVFILGLPRSGTSHLYELLGQSPQLCYPTRFDCWNPHTFLTLRKMGLHRLLARTPAWKRPQDNVETGWNAPEEDIVALAMMACAGERDRLVFPRNLPASAYAGDPDARTDAEDAAVAAGLRDFTRKLVYLHRKSVLLKSPGHTRRVAALLDVFPRARFVTIFRDPVHQVASLMDMHRSRAALWAALQRTAAPPDAELVARRQGAALQQYFAFRHLIPAANLMEIKYEDLVEDREVTLLSICEKLSLLPPENLPLVARRAAAGARPARELPAGVINFLRYYRPLYDAGLYSELG
ncbi:MAG: sulfotransferase [Synechococcus sp.]|nr:sulfotransferase [Synechococcus sp.]